MIRPGTRGREPTAPRTWRSQRLPAVEADSELLAAEMYRTYHRPLLAFVSRITGGDRQLAEDVVQETMVRAWQNIDQLKPDAGSLMPWLATVARRVVIDHQRRRAARPQEAGDEQLDTLQAPDEINGLLRSMMVSEALLSLSPAHREVLVETVLADRTVTEAAERLNIPVGTAKSRIYYALRALRTVLDDMGVAT